MAMNLGTMTAHIGLDNRALEMNAARSQRTLQNMAGGMRGLGRAAIGMAAGIAVTSGAIAGMAIFGKVTRLGIEFEHQMVTVGGIMRATAAEMESVKEAARSLGETTEYTATQAGQALYFLASSGFDAAQSVAALPHVLDLATAGNVDLANAADIAVNALRAMSLQVEDLSRVNDVMYGTVSRTNTDLTQMAEAFRYAAPLANAFGYSVEELSGLIGTLANSGVKGSMAGTQLAMAFQEANKAALKLGYESSDLIDVLQRMSAEGRTGQDVLELFGIRAGRAALILMQNADAARALQRDLHNVGGETKKQAETVRAATRGAFQELKSVFEAIGEKAFTKYGDRLKEMVRSMTSWLRLHRDQIVSYIKFIADAVLTIVGVLGQVINAVANIASVFTGHLDDMVRETRSAVDGINNELQRIGVEAEKIPDTFAQVVGRSVQEIAMLEAAELRARDIAEGPPDMSGWQRALAVWSTFVNSAYNAASAVLKSINVILNTNRKQFVRMMEGISLGLINLAELARNAAAQNITAAYENLREIKRIGKNLILPEDAEQQRNEMISQWKEIWAWAKDNVDIEGIFLPGARAQARWLASISKTYEEARQAYMAWLLSPDAAMTFDKPVQQSTIDSGTVQAASTMWKDILDSGRLTTTQLENAWKHYSALVEQNIQLQVKEFQKAGESQVGIEQWVQVQRMALAKEYVDYFGKQMDRINEMANDAPPILPTIPSTAGGALDEYNTALQESIGMWQSVLNSEMTTVAEMSDAWSQYANLREQQIRMEAMKYEAMGMDKVAIDAWVQTQWRNLARERSETLRDQAYQQREWADTIAKGMQDSMQSFFFDAMRGEIKSLGEYMQQIFAAVGRKISEQLADDIAKGLRGKGAGDVWSWFGNLFNSGSKPGAGSGGGGGSDFIDFIPAEDIPQTQHGGIFTKPTIRMIGEAGPEAVIPLDQIESVAADAGGGSDTFVFNFHGVSDMNTFRQNQAELASRMRLAVANSRRNI